ncbi:MAG: hypothetical protein ACTHY5_10310 [Oceanisphaera sp.]|uniref:hypothetical protein n=1 Tax=Oceanisphaera sp. TaxID=1929979 RepID=UPI003F991D41
MSIPTLTYGCTGCDSFCWSLMKHAGFYYLVEETRFQVYVEMGVCHQCTEIYPIEVFPEVAEIRQLKQTLETQRAQLFSEKAQHDQANQSLRWWQRKKDLPYALSQLNSSCEDIEKRVSNMEQTYNALSGRIALPKCLRCGSTEHTLFPSYQNTGNDKDFLGLKHPRCGGELIVINDGLRLNVKPAAIGFDIEANKL